MDLNKKCDKAKRALEAYSESKGVQAYVVADLLADVMHLCEREGWNFKAALASAKSYHSLEKNAES